MSDQGAATLAYAVRPRALARPLGNLCLVASALTGVPLLAALLAGEHVLVPPLTGGTALLGGAGLLLRRRPGPARIQQNEALVLTTAIFIACAFVGAVAFRSAGLAPADAVFEAISGVTTTGLSTLAHVDDRPRSFLFARAWMQWYGGLGIGVLAVALLQGSGITARRLAPEGELDDLLGSTRLHARRVLFVYAILTAIGVVGLWLLGAEPFDALTYALAAVSTGGFAPHDASLEALAGWPVRAAVIALCLAGAVTLPLYARAWREGPRVLWRDSELRALLLLGAAGSLVLAALWYGRTDLALADVPLLAFSAQTTAGFSSVPVAELDPASKLVLIVSMSIGGSVGSTAGGVKLLRILVAVALLRWTLLRARLPTQAVAEARIGGERLDEDDVRRVLVLFGGFGGVLFASWFAFVAWGYPPLDSLFEVTSALGTVGLSTGVTSADLPVVLKGVLCADMLLGRLEIVAVVVLFAPRTWFGRRNLQA